MAKLHYALPALVGVLTLSACPGDDAGGSGSTTAATGDSTGTDGGPATNTNTNTNATTSATGDSGTVDSTGPGPSDSSSTSEPGCVPECLEGQSCVNGICIGDPVTTGQMCPMWGEGNYDECLLEDGGVDPTLCGAPAICIVDNTQNPTIGVCSVNGCNDFCDCPQPPSGGTAACEDLTGDMMANCHLTCEGEAECPDGYICFAGALCVPGDPSGVPPYGDCINPQAMCAEGICIVDNTTTPSVGQCSSPCMDVGDCPAPAQGGNPQCTDLTGQGNNFCSLSCAGGCPAGMECFANALCVWPLMDPVEVGYGDCAPPIPTDGCLASESCETNMAGTHAICTEPGCAAAMDCPEAVDGNAVVSCGDPLGGGADTCYLDCSGGETCPTGQECVDSSYCAWAVGTPIFEEDFEGMNFPAMWTRIDNDGLTPEPMSVGAALTDAWDLLADMEGTQAAASTSWYAPAGTSDDWMITPQISIGANSMLTWQARSIEENVMFQDGYEVLVSTTGTAIADFTTVVFTIAAEPATYQTHVVDLAAEGFMNQDIHIAFRNITNDGNVLFVDNVAVFN